VERFQARGKVQGANQLAVRPRVESEALHASDLRVSVEVLHDGSRVRETVHRARRRRRPTPNAGAFIVG